MRRLRGVFLGSDINDSASDTPAYVEAGALLVMIAVVGGSACDEFEIVCAYKRPGKGVVDVVSGCNAGGGAEGRKKVRTFWQKRHSSLIETEMRSAGATTSARVSGSRVDGS